MNAAAPCVQPPPMVRLEDYDGPLKKTVGTFARPLERKSVHPPHYKPGAVLCTLKFKDKFRLFVQDSLDPVTFLATGFSAGLDQAENSDPSYGQGAEGTAGALAPNLPVRPPPRSLRTLRIPGYFRRTPATTA